MRIGVFGAGGRVGKEVVRAILARPDLNLTIAIVSPTSPLAGMPVVKGGIDYRPLDASVKDGACDVIIDFSTPASSLSLQKELGVARLPVVIGTTGFTDEQDRQLTSHAARRPLLVSANFARGFEVFRGVAGRLARQVTDGEVSVAETYHVRKKNEPSGTSRLLADLVRRERSEVVGAPVPEVPIDICREGDVVGINEVRFDLGSAEILLRYRVHALAAYTEGALIAAEWLVTHSPASGRFSLNDTLARSDTA